MSALTRNALQALIGALGNGDRFDVKEKILEHASENGLPKEAAEYLVSMAVDHLERGRLGRLQNLSFLGIVLTQGKILEEAKFQDLFRPSIERSRISYAKLTEPTFRRADNRYRATTATA